MRHEDKWVCDSTVSHHVAVNKQYLASYKRFSTQVNISLVDRRTILAFGSGLVNVGMLA
jgi:hypothetical protein